MFDPCFCTKCRCLLSHLNLLQAMVEKTYNSLVNISLNMHGARAVQAKQQGSSGSLRGQLRNFRGQHRKACRILMKCGKTRTGIPARDFFHMLPSVTGVSWSFSGCKWTIKDCGAMEFYVLLDLPHVRMCQKLIDVVRLVPTCMRRLVVELAWFGTVEGLLMQQIWANDDASRKPLQGWYFARESQATLKIAKSTEFYSRQAALDQAVVPLTKDKFKIGRWGAWLMGYPWNGAPTFWWFHVFFVVMRTELQRQLIQWTFPQGPQWQPRGPEMFGGAEPGRTWKKTSPGRGIGETTSIVF